MLPLLRIALVCMAVHCTGGSSVNENPLQVDTEEGPVLGHYIGTGSVRVREFLGIPYASPPVGSLRFAPPEPAKNRSGQVYNASFMAPMCPQNVQVPAIEMSEDCLYLSIYTPAIIGAEPLPVFFWIYGGSFLYGGGAGYGWGTLEGSKIYNGYTLAPQGVIVVAINYRVGALGFLKSADMTGNYGFSDQRLALEWVNRNIKAFGGDPSRITIGGQSAGAQSVLAHLASPLSRPLFSQAIMESAPIGLPFHNNVTADKVAGEFAKYLDCSPGNLTCLRLPDVATVLKAQGYAEENSFDIFDILKDFEAFNPTVDNEQLLTQPFFTLNSLLPPSETKPLLAGSNLNDALEFVYAEFPLPEGQISTYGILVDTYGFGDAPGVSQTYPFSAPDGRVNVSRASTDMLFYCALRNISRGKPYSDAQSSAPAFLYRWEHVPSYKTDETSLPECYTKVCHGDELRFVFGNFTGPNGTFAISPFEESLTKSVQNYWVNFIKYGNPNGATVYNNRRKSKIIANTKRERSGAPEIEWPQYVPADDAIMVFSDTIGPLASIEASQCENLWDRIGYLRRHMKI